MNRVERWIKRLGYGDVPGAVVSSAQELPPEHPYALEVEAMFPVAGEVGASAVLCIDRVPTVCLIDAAKLSQSNQIQAAQVRGFCERLWNQNLARIVLVAKDETLEAWAVDDPKVAHETIPANAEDRFADFSFQGLLSGEVLKDRAAWFDPHKRVDKTLLDNVAVLVQRLSKSISPNKARQITASVIFVAYLEDRQIVTALPREPWGFAIN